MKVIHPVSTAFQLGIGMIITAATAFLGTQGVATGGVWIGLIPLVITCIVALRKPLARWRAVRRTFPRDWRDWLSDHLPYYRHLPPERRTRFEQDIQIFLEEQTIEGVAGVVVTDRLRLALAAATALLINGHPSWDVPHNRSFLLYPANFNEEYLLEDDQTEADIMGRAHGQGPIILSVPAVNDAIDYPRDGYNVILHELAHLLDFENLLAADLSPASARHSRRAIEQLLDEEMQKIDAGDSLLGSYAGQSPAEFLAVATERFFERPAALKRRHPALYELLTDVYNQDPAGIDS